MFVRVWMKFVAISQCRQIHGGEGKAGGGEDRRFLWMELPSAFLCTWVCWIVDAIWFVMQLFLLGQTYSIFKPGQWRSRRRKSRRKSRKLRKLAVVGKLRISTGLSRDKTKPRDKTRALQRCDNNKTNIAAAAAAAYKIIIIIVIISCCSCCCFSCIHTCVTSEISYGLFVNYLHFFASCRILRIRSVLARTTTRFTWFTWRNICAILFFLQLFFIIYYCSD